MTTLIKEYCEAHSLEELSRADRVLMLLRIGALSEAEELAGVRITRCPPAVPPWPPKPVGKAPAGPRISKLRTPNPIQAGTAMRERYKKLRVGASVESLLQRGVTRRDLRHWQKHGHVEIA